MATTAWPARTRRQPRRRKTRPAHVDPQLAAAYAGAIHRVRQLGDELVAARASGADVEERRRLHRLIDQELVKAIGAATVIHKELFEAAGGMHRAAADPQVLLWKRRLNDALTLRSHHQLAEYDDAGVMTPRSEHPRSRAASGPHQAGLHFDVEGVSRGEGRAG